MSPASFALCDIAALLEAISARLEGDLWWHPMADRIGNPGCPQRAHLAVLNEPYLSYILEGRKTIESRFSRNRVAPFDQVRHQDVLLLKSQSGPIVAVAEVAHTESYVLDPPTWGFIRERFSVAICADDPDFWAERRDARYATLMKLDHVMRIGPIEVEKTDRRGWVVLGSQSLSGISRDQLVLPQHQAVEKPRADRRPEVEQLQTRLDSYQLRLLA